MKFYLAFTGLLMILQPDPQGPAEILFLEGENRQIEYRDQDIEVMDHFLRVDIDALGDSPTTLFLPDGIEMGLNLESPTTKVERHRGAGFLSFSKIYAEQEDCETKMRNACQGPMALQTCRKGGTDLLTGRFHLQGGSLQPAEVKENRIVTEDLGALPAPTPQDLAGRQLEREPWKVCKVGDEENCENSPVTQTTFNGALYTLELPVGTESVDVWLGSQRLSVPIIEQDACSQIGDHPADEPCGYLLVTNSFNVPRGHEPEIRGIDLHFLLNYDLFKPAAEGCELMVPVWEFYGKGLQPGWGSRCIPPSQP